MVHEGKPHNNEENLRRACIARGGTWENGVCFEADKDEPRRKGALRPRDPGREELRQKQLREDPQFAADVALFEERRVGIERARAEERLKTPEQIAIETERERLFREETPVRRELDPAVLGIETAPVIGPFAKELFDLIPGFEERSKKHLLPLTPEVLRTAALTEIERIELEKGLTQSERFGRFAETINIGELAKWIPGLGGAERPSQNVQTIVKSLRQLKTRATDVEMKFNKGLLTRSAANDRIRLIEEELQAGESRIKLLIQNSPELKFNSDGVNFIEGKILETRERLFDAKLTTAGEPTLSATDLEVLETLQSSIDAEDFEIPGL